MKRMTRAQREEMEESEGAAVFQEALTLAAAQEGIDPVDLALAVEDRGWTKLGNTQNGELPWLTRRLNIIRARLYWLLDPHATAAVRTWTNYTLGSGMTFKAADAGLQTQLQKFWDNPKNRTVTTAEGQRKHNRRLLVDGEVFYAIFDAEPTPLIRKIDCIEVTDFVYDPEDSEIIWAFRRERSLPDGTREVLFYRNWCYPDQDLQGAMTKDEQGAWGLKVITPEEGVLVYHLPFDAFHQRGNSLFSSSLSWMAAMRQFMEDRIAITKGLAKYIQKLTVKGGASQITKIATAMQNLGKPGGTSGVPAPPVPGGIPGRSVREAAKTFLQNDNVSIDNMPRTTGAGDARTDFKTIRLMIAGGVGMTEPYFGDAESGNLATATAMELPMLKQFQSHQQMLGDAWVDIFTIVAYFMGGSTSLVEPVEVDVDFPPIVEADIVKIATAITNVCAEFPELKQPEILKLLLTIMGLNNVDDIMKQVLIDAKANAEKADNIANGKNPDGSPLANVLPQPVVLPAKAARQQTQAGPQKVAKSIAAAAESLAVAVEAELALLEEAMEFEEEEVIA